MCGELWEELVWCRCVNDEDCQAPDGGRGLGEHVRCAVAMPQAVVSETESQSGPLPRVSHLLCEGFSSVCEV